MWVQPISFCTESKFRFASFAVALRALEIERVLKPGNFFPFMAAEAAFDSVYAKALSFVITNRIVEIGPFHFLGRP
jgi:hypothetical protein